LVFPLAGAVHIDGHVPNGKGDVIVIKGDVIVMLYSPGDLADYERCPLSAICDRDGRFEFSTYAKGDGMPPGEYVLTKKGLRQLRELYWGPDQLGNRFNDPEKNRSISSFRITHRSPGKKDYVFDLKTEGIAPVIHPGAHALTTLKAFMHSPHSKKDGNDDSARSDHDARS
jgi:hypothetical protein